MKLIIFVFCLIFITIGYTSAAPTPDDEQIPVELISDPTDSSEVIVESEIEPEIKIEEVPPEEKPTQKPVELSKKRLQVYSRRIKSDERTTTEKLIEKPVINRPTEKLEIKSIPVVDRGSSKFTENVIHSISNGPDDYSFSFKTEEGHNRDESVHIDRNSKSLNDNDEDLGNVSAKGSYSFISADGFEYTVDYYADSKGYHPKVNVRKI